MPTPGTPAPNPFEAAFPDGDSRFDWLTWSAIGVHVAAVDEASGDPIDGDGNRINAVNLETIEAEAAQARTDARAARDLSLQYKTEAEAARDSIVQDQQELANKAPLESPDFTGTPTAPTAAPATESTQLATTAFVHALVGSVVGLAPSTLDTLAEIAALVQSEETEQDALVAAVAGKLARDANLGDLSDVGAALANLGAAAASDATGAITQAERTRIGHLSVTAATDLDAIRQRVDDLDAAVVLKGAWDASAGTFPGAGAAQAGWAYIVSVAGTVDGVQFSAGDRVLAIVDDAPVANYAGSWLHLNYSDLVASVAGLTGNPTAAQLRAALGVEADATADQTDEEIEAAYNARVSVVSQAEAEAGVATTVRRWTAQRVAQAVAALSNGLSFLRERLLTTGTNATVNAAEVGVADGVGTTNVDLALAPRGTGALIAGPAPDGTSAGGNKRGARAIDLQTARASGAQVAAGAYAVLLGGQNNIATNAYSTILGGNTNNAVADSVVMMGSRGIGDRYGMFVLSQYMAPFGVRDAQGATFLIGAKTADAAPKEMFLNGSSERLTIPAGKVLAFTVSVEAVQSDGSKANHYLRRGQIKNLSGTTSLVYEAPIGVDHEDDAALALVVTASDANDALTITVTGTASETWRWYGRVDCVELVAGS